MPKTIYQRIMQVAVLGIATLLGIIILPIFTPAQSRSQLEFRINMLESEISELRGQISRIEYQASGRIRPDSPSTAAPNSVNPRRLSGDPMFNNLATLVIEVKQDVKKIEERLSKVESRISPANR